MKLNKIIKNTLYALPFVVASVLSTQEAKGQDRVIAPIGNINSFTSQDTTITAKEYNKLTTKEDRDKTIDLRVQGDWVKDVPSNLAQWNCNQSTLQLIVNSHDWGKEDTYYGGALFYNSYNGSEKDITQLYANGGTTKDMGKLGLPTYYVTLNDKVTVPLGHAMNAILTGDTITNWNAWNFIEPQLGVTNAKIGKIFSLPENCKQVQIYAQYLFKNNNHEKNYGQIRILEFEIVDSKAKLTYNINNDSQMVYNGDNLDPTNPRWTIPLNERVHLFETRHDAITGIEQKLLEKHSIEAYPIPAHNYITIDTKISSPTRLDIKLYDVIGRLVNEQTTNEYQDYKEKLDISNIASGIYILDIKAESDGKINKRAIKFVKQ